MHEVDFSTFAKIPHKHENNRTEKRHIGPEYEKGTPASKIAAKKEGS
jgi:hypothetical protein